MSNEELINLYSISSPGDREDIRGSIFNQNQGLIKKVVLNFKRFDIFDDLFQEGTIGLLNAIEGYNHEKGKFTTYAFMKIFQKVIRYIEKDRIIRIPTHKAYLDGNIKAYTVADIENLDIVEDNYLDTENSLDLLERADVVKKYASSLSLEEREFFIDKFIKGKSMRELCAKCNRSIKFVRNKEKRMRSELTEILKNKDLWED